MFQSIGTDVLDGVHSCTVRTLLVVAQQVAGASSPCAVDKANSRATFVQRHAGLVNRYRYVINDLDVDAAGGIAVPIAVFDSNANDIAGGVTHHVGRFVQRVGVADGDQACDRINAIAIEHHITVLCGDGLAGLT